jgi:hypothetical protein
MSTDLVRLICNRCGYRTWLPSNAERTCPECPGKLRPMGPLEGLFDRWFGPPELTASELHHRHLQLVELLWTKDGRAREFYDLLQPKGVSYAKFVARVTPLICRGLREGWIEARLPPAPVPDDSAYELRFVDPERFAEELAALFAPGR